MKIGIFRSTEEPFGFYESDVSSMLHRIIQGTCKILDPGEKRECSLIDDPPVGTKASRVGEIVVRKVIDPDVYETKAGEVDKPDTDRKPEDNAGAWAVQSLIFSKDRFDLAAAKKWIADSDDFGNHGMDETDTSYRFRQFDPGWFSEFRTITITEGVSAAYGKIKAAASDDDEAAKDLEKSILANEAVRTVNEGILKRGIKLIKESARIQKNEDDTEERFILGLVLEPTDGEDEVPLKPDTQDDVYSKMDVRKTAHGWMEFFGAIDMGHSWQPLSKGTVRILESYLAPVAFTIGKGKDAYEVTEGTWMLALRIADDAIWEAVKNNEIGAYSIGGTAAREPLEAA